MIQLQYTITFVFGISFFFSILPYSIIRYRKMTALHTSATKLGLISRLSLMFSVPQTGLFVWHTKRSWGKRVERTVSAQDFLPRYVSWLIPTAKPLLDRLTRRPKVGKMIGCPRKADVNAVVLGLCNSIAQRQ